MKKMLKEHMMRFFYRTESSHLLSIVRRGLTMLIPALVVGTVACAILCFPNDTFSYIITEKYAGIGIFLKTIYRGTFGIFSLLLVIALSISYAMDKSEEIDKRFFYCIVAVTSFGTQFVMVSDEIMWKILGGTGCFFALSIGMLSCFMFSRLQENEFLSLKKYTTGMEIVSANAIQSILPAAITIATFTLVPYILTTVFKEESVYTLLTGAVYQVFKGTGNDFLSALIYTVMVHVLWIFGFHGSNMLEAVVVEKFSTFGENIIFSKSFSDTFVMMGGCGASICVVFAIFFFARKKRMRSLGKIALPTVIFNANEILSFGIPLVLNPVMAIPFVLVPVMALVVSYLATTMGLVPCVTHEIIWTMPPVISGYVATGSIAGSILQIIIIVIGVAMYAPFLRMYEEVYEIRMKEKLDNLVEEMQAYEEKGESPDFLHRVDDNGMVVRMLLQDLKTALKQKQLYLLYQPQLDSEGRYVGAEALIRWQHMEYGFIYPPLIVYLATTGGFLYELEQELVDMSVKAVAKISKIYKDDFKISINLTAHSLNWKIEEYIEEKLEEYQAPAEKLWLEITEHDMLANLDSVTKKIEQLKAKGHKLLIDDFGMGHTSLLYLQSDNFDGIKLDGSLVNHILERENNQKIVASIAELSKQLGILLIAEFVESEEQREKLEKLGCHCYQGYLYGKPMVLAEFIERICEKH